MTRPAIVTALLASLASASALSCAMVIGLDEPERKLETTPDADLPILPDEVYVSAAFGDDNGKGTREAPLKTIGRALQGTSKTIHVCEGVYPENLVIRRAVTVSGGLTCAWVADTAKRPSIKPPAGMALDLADVNAPVVLRDLALEAVTTPAAPGSSTVGARVARATNVLFERVAITAGSGVAGANGVAGSNYTAAAKKGTAASATGGGPAVTCTCENKDTSIGGAGGARPSGTPAEGKPSRAGGKPGNASACNGGTGTAGGGGEPGPGAGALGTYIDAWVPAAGAPGKAGAVGQGGGGAYASATTGGGGGGCGGCGGAGGSAGGGGGASIALLVDTAAVTLKRCAITSGDGGNGGVGGPAQAGQPGAGGGAGATCTGGTGGAGGVGGPGGGGAGGISIGVAYKNDLPPTLDETPIAVGKQGSGGWGGPNAPLTSFGKEGQAAVLWPLP